ncbi:MAG: NAD(P)H-hydrate dehydratase [Eubacteriales bacterium]
MDYSHLSARRAQMKAMDSYAVRELGISEQTLMDSAARAVLGVLDTKGLTGCGCRAVVLCGSGGNGGDGWALCAMLKESGASVIAVKCFEGTPVSHAAGYFYDKIKDNVDITDIPTALASPSLLRDASLIVDCVYGTGFRGGLDTHVSELFALANSSGAMRVSVDIPSGADCDDGRVAEGCFRADLTVTFVVPKTGLCSYPAADVCGEVIVRDIGMPSRAVRAAGLNDLFPTKKYIASLLPKRRDNSNKGDFGRVLGICGSDSMTGAAVLAAKGALRSGAGLYACACPRDILRVLQGHLIEPIFLPLPDGRERIDILKREAAKSSCVLFGCGCGGEDEVSETLRYVLPEVKCPIVLDADALNALSRSPELWGGISTPVIITPHPGEMSRLCGRSVVQIQNDRINTARAFSEEHGCVTVLKGARTVIASPDGRLCVNPTGNAGMARGGSGDVLAGVIASLAAQGIDPFEAAVSGVYVHGLAGDMCRDEVGMYGMTAGDIAAYIPRAFKELINLLND